MMRNSEKNPKSLDSLAQPSRGEKEKSLMSKSTLSGRREKCKAEHHLKAMMILILGRAELE
jgi:hypothetical protein